MAGLEGQEGMTIDNVKSQALCLSHWSRRNRVVKLHFPALNAELTVLTQEPAFSTFHVDARWILVAMRDCSLY